MDAIIYMFSCLMMLSLSPRGYDVCNFLFQERSQSMRDLTSCLLDCTDGFLLLPWTVLLNTLSYVCVFLYVGK